ncbi:BTB/POZ domain [Trinorchestia longiramus]|nr:BTB/POZ domain [Trinorchestia longiramus]
MDGGLLSLKWNNHRSTFFYVLSNVRKKECYTDVTLACDGKFYPVHKLILSTCSEYFEQMFEQTQCKHPVIVLKDIRSEELESLLSYMYVGEVNVVQEKLSGLIKAAECLRIKGLAVPDEEPQPTKSSGGSREKRTSDNSLSSEAKRRRQDDSAFSSQKQTSSSSNREDSNRRRVDQSSSNKFNRNNASSSSNSGSVNSCRESRENTSERISSNREVAQSDEQQPSAVSEAGDDEIELKAEEPPDAEEDMPSEMPPSDADAVKQEPIDLDAVYLSDSNSASETKDMLVEDNFAEADGQQHFMDELLGQNSASDQHGGVGDYGEGGEGSSSSGAPSNQQQQHMDCEQDSDGRGQQDECEVLVVDDKLAAAHPVLAFQRLASATSSSSKHFSLAASARHSEKRDTSFYSKMRSPSTLLADYDLTFLSGRDRILTSDLQHSFGTKLGRPGRALAGLSSEATPGSPSILVSTVQADDMNSYKRFHCSICGHSSLQKKDIVKHTRIHTGEKPFKCQFCDYRSTQSSNVNTHVKRVHPELYAPATDPATGCAAAAAASASGSSEINVPTSPVVDQTLPSSSRPRCPRSTSDELQQFSMLQWSAAGATASYQPAYRGSTRGSPGGRRVKTCAKGGDLMESYSVGAAATAGTRGRGRRQCPLCPYSTHDLGNFKRHKRVHTSEKPYACSMCNYRSAQSNNLKSHVFRQHLKLPATTPSNNQM